MTTFLVTGGAGFIGSHLCEALLGLGYAVVNLDNFNDFYTPEIKRRNVDAAYKLLADNNIDAHRYSVAEGDIRDLKFLKDVFDCYKFDAVIHLAACAGVRPSIENPLLYSDVNINGTLNLLELCREK